jgi:Chemotaxis phosphatase CheX
MSSPTSAPRPDADTMAALGAAAVNVAEDSLFAFAEPCSADALAVSLDARPDGETWLRAAVRFRGPFQGIAEVSLPRDLALELCASFGGESPDDVAPQDVRDFAGEFANMMCGLWLTRAHSHARFDLDAPRIDEFGRPVAVAPADVFGLLVNDAPVIVTLRPAESQH